MLGAAAVAALLVPACGSDDSDGDGAAALLGDVTPDEVACEMLEPGLSADSPAQAVVDDVTLGPDGELRVGGGSFAFIAVMETPIDEELEVLEGAIQDAADAGSTEPLESGDAREAIASIDAWAAEHC